MAYDLEFVVVLGFACVLFGIIVGMMIFKCYENFSCVHASSTSNGQSHLVHESGNVSPTAHAAGISENSYPQIQAITGNPNFHSFYDFPPSMNPVRENAAPTLAPAQEGSLSEQDGRKYRRRTNSEPVNNARLNFGGGSSRSGTNNINRKPRHHNTSSDIRQGSSRTDIVGHAPYNQQSVFDNSSASSTNIKEVGNKTMPFDWMTMPHERNGLPTIPSGKSHQSGSDDHADDLNDITSVKMLAHCPEDIRKIFEPCDTSMTINVREKKLVYVCRTLDDGGGLLELENMGISLFVPPGAIPFNQRSLVSLVLNWDLNDNPFMEKKEALVSPVVFCGPHGTSFDKPCILKFKHCAHDTRYAKVLTSQTDLFESKNWQNVNSYLDEDEDEDLNEDDKPFVQAGVALSVNECEVEVPHFSLFTCIMGSKHRLLKKWIQVAVFTHDIAPERRHQQIRVYFLNKTPCALQWAIQNEAQYNFSLACPDTTFQFLEAGENMEVLLKSVSEGWELVCQETDEPIRSVFFEQIWHGACPHASMCFRRVKNNRKNSSLSVVTETDVEAGLEEDNKCNNSNAAGHRFGDSGKTADSSVSAVEKMFNDTECSEINISLRLSQERCENLSVPLDVLAHNLRVNIMDTQVKVINEGPF